MKSFPVLLPPPTPCRDSHGNHQLGPGEGGGLQISVTLLNQLHPIFLLQPDARTCTPGVGDNGTRSRAASSASRTATPSSSSTPPTHSTRSGSPASTHPSENRHSAPSQRNICPTRSPAQPVSMLLHCARCNRVSIGLEA